MLDGAPPRSKGELIVDVRAKDSDKNFLVEVQHRIEPLFPHRAVLYAAADLVAQHTADERRSDALRPVHSLSFCDYDFARGGFGTGIGSTLNTWCKAAAHVPATERAIHSFNLQPRALVLERLKQVGNAALADELAARVSFTFALLPHAPRLADLSVETPRILQWASVIAHLRADNVDAVPRAVRRPGIDRLLGVLSESAAETELERLRTVRDGAVQEAAVACARAEAKAEGVAEGVADALRLLNVTTVAAYRARFGADPPTELAQWRRRAPHASVTVGATVEVIRRRHGRDTCRRE